MLSLPQLLPRSHLTRLLVAVFLLAIAAVPVIPAYVTQQWPWTNPPDVPHLTQLKQLRTAGLSLSGWTTLNHQVAELGGHKWSIQTMMPTDAALQAQLNAPVVLMLRPQTWHRDQPQVDWMDINGVQQWTADSQRRLTFTISIPQPGNSANSRQVDVAARFLRGWNQKQTYAVLQWYAWSDGGHPSPSQWFWADLSTQWRDRHRMPWVAVSLLVPIKPLGDINSVRSLVESIGQSIQSALMVNALNPNP
ncbi:MAG TPA: cyanoexosortase B system-associated protein [Crinalium sp.]